MMRASPAELRKAIEAANVMVKSGILFVPMPALHPEDLATLQAQAMIRLDRLVENAEKEEQPQ